MRGLSQPVGLAETLVGRTFIICGQTASARVRVRGYPCQERHAGGRVGNLGPAHSAFWRNDTRTECYNRGIAAWHR